MELNKTLFRNECQSEMNDWYQINSWLVLNKNKGCKISTLIGTSESVWITWNN